MAVLWSSWMRNLLGGLWNPEQGIQRAGPGSYEGDAGQVVTDSRAMQIGAVFRCVRIIAETAASLPVYAYRDTGNGQRERLERSHWLSRLLEEPNPTQTGDEWREAMFAQMAGWGNGYSRIARNAAGQPVELWVQKADIMEVERQRDRTLKYRHPDADGRMVELSASQILHLRAFSLDGVMGASPLAMARESLGLSVAAEKYAGSFFAQGGRPAGVMTSEKLLSEKQREQIRREYGDMGEKGATGKRFWLLEASLKYTPVTVSPEDMQMLQTRAFQIADIARFFGVPLFLLMETEKSTSWGTGIEQQNLGFLTYTLRPYLTRMVHSINRWIVPDSERGRIFVDVDESPLQTMDAAAQEKLLSSFAQVGIQTRNEIRARLKMPRSTDPNADKLTAQSALVPIERLGEAPRAAAADDPTQRAAPHVVVMGEAFEPITNAIASIAGKQVELSGAIEKLAANAGRLKRTIEVPVRDAHGRIQMVTRQEEYTDGA